MTQWCQTPLRPQVVKVRIVTRYGKEKVCKALNGGI